VEKIPFAKESRSDDIGQCLFQLTGRPQPIAVVERGTVAQLLHELVQASFSRSQQLTMDASSMQMDPPSTISWIIIIIIM
jgi:hypothetical protein